MQVAKAYVQILYDLQVRRVARAQAEHDAQLLEQIVARKEAGKVSSADVSAQKATLAGSKLSLTQAENNLRLSTLALTQLLELPSPDGFSIVEPSEDELVPGLLCNPEEIYLRALGIRPVIRSAELQLERSRIGSLSPFALAERRNRHELLYHKQCDYADFRRAAEEQFQPVYRCLAEYSDFLPLQHQKRRAQCPAQL